MDPTAVVIGDVVVGEHSSIWPGSVVRGDIHQIRIGDCCSIQDGSILHVTHAGPYNPDGYALELGNEVTVGHRVILHGCKIEDSCLIGMGSIIMDGAVIHRHVVLGANSLVPPGKELESGFLWLGSPAKKVRPLTEEEMAYFAYTAQYYVKLKDRHLNNV